MTNIYIALSQEDGASLTIDGQLDVLTKFLESVTGRKPEPGKVAAVVTKAQGTSQKSRTAEHSNAHA